MQDTELIFCPKFQKVLNNRNWFDDTKSLIHTYRVVQGPACILKQRNRIFKSVRQIIKSKQSKCDLLLLYPKMSLNTHFQRSEIIAKCKVCNDETINASPSYGAIACPPCRNFFRRQTSMRQRNLRICYSNGTCEITKETRTYCQFCRYHKCLNIGMLPERIHQSKNWGERQPVSEKFEGKFRNVPVGP